MRGAEGSNSCQGGERVVRGPCWHGAEVDYVVNDEQGRNGTAQAAVSVKAARRSARARAPRPPVAGAAAFEKGSLRLQRARICRTQSLTKADSIRPKATS